MYAQRFRYDFTVSVKFLVVLCTFLNVFLAADANATWIIVCGSFVYIAVQRKWRTLFGYAVFYGVLELLPVFNGAVRLAYVDIL